MSVTDILNSLERLQLSPLDLISRSNTAEKLIELMLLGVPNAPSNIEAHLQGLSEALAAEDTSEVNVLVFGGGTGLSNVVGGDSRSPRWSKSPFKGLKEIFPKTKSVVCVTDDGGSTGELLKKLPLIAVGDIRHVLLSSIQKKRLQKKYQLGEEQSNKVIDALADLFNYRFSKHQACHDGFNEAMDNCDARLPKPLGTQLNRYLKYVAEDPRISNLLSYPNCLGNLIVAAAIYIIIEGEAKPSSSAIRRGLRELGELIGVPRDAVMPCTTTPCQLKIMYSNGVLVTGESKSAEAKRNFPVHRVFVAFSEHPEVLPEVLKSIEQADVIVFAPGSLYTSIVPVMQIPSISDSVRKNSSALKILVSNLWVQKGETDLAWGDPKRRFYVSDLIKAYHRNIPGGVHDLFQHVLILGLQDIPGSILQSYALEDKVPIYLDRENVSGMGFTPIEASIFSQKELLERTLKHDPDSLAKAVRTIWLIRNQLETNEKSSLPLATQISTTAISGSVSYPCSRYKSIVSRISELDIDGPSETITEIIWRHKDIHLDHLRFIKGVSLIEAGSWSRSQIWDNIISFFDPDDRYIKIRRDALEDNNRFEMAFLVALGQSLLGDYAARKEMLPISWQGQEVGKVYKLTLRTSAERICLFNDSELDRFLRLARMRRVADDYSYTRLLNAREGFTPPGLLFGLTYAWYLDNRFVDYMEYKMMLIRSEVSDLIPEQIRVLARRNKMIDFFRNVVFRQGSYCYEEVMGDRTNAV